MKVSFKPRYNRLWLTRLTAPTNQPTNHNPTSAAGATIESLATIVYKSGWLTRHVLHKLVVSFVLMTSILWWNTDFFRYIRQHGSTVPLAHKKKRKKDVIITTVLKDKLNNRAVWVEVWLVYHLVSWCCCCCLSPSPLLYLVLPAMGYCGCRNLGPLYF